MSTNTISHCETWQVLREVLINGQTATHDWRLTGPLGRYDLCLHTQFLPLPLSPSPHPRLFVFSSLFFTPSPDSPLFVPWVFLLGPQVTTSRLQSYEVSHLFLFEIGFCFVAEVGLVLGILQCQPLSKCWIYRLSRSYQADVCQPLNGPGSAAPCEWENE